MPPSAPVERARLDRDRALARLRRLTFFVAASAVALTAAASALAAVTIPGRSLEAGDGATGGEPAQRGAATPSSADDQAQQGFTPPNQLPQPASGGRPAAVSGGS